MNQIVALDIGGTNARYAIAELAPDAPPRLGEPVTLATADHASFQSAWRQFEESLDGPAPRNLAMAVAGRISDDVFRFTNNPWVVRLGDLREQMGLENILLINDFEAIGHAVASAPEEAFRHLCGPDVPLPAEGLIGVIGPGTGLGVAHVWRDRQGYRVQPTEGGHLDFAPLDAIEDRLLARLRQRHRRVSTERVVSGPAIVDIYETLAAIEGRPIQLQDDRAIWQSGMERSDPLATAAVERFCMSLGSVAGDIALAQGASAMVIAGGLGQRLADILVASDFAQRFKAKGRFEAMMASLPVKLITHPQPGLLGAAAAFAAAYP